MSERDDGTPRGDKGSGRAPYLGPLTAALFEREVDQPPALMREWHGGLRHSGDLVFLWAAAAQSKAGGFSWADLTVHQSNDPGVSARIVRTPAEHVERLLAPLARAGRVRILQALYDEPLPSGALAEAVGLTGGGLYHHLRELKYAAYITDTDGRYALTDLGRQLLITMTVFASRIIVDRGEQGLGVGTHATSSENETDERV